MGSMFSARKLEMHAVMVYVNGDSAWSEFHWDFHATLRKDGSEVTTHGIETQVYCKENGAWRLVHVHYRGSPAPALRDCQADNPHSSRGSFHLVRNANAQKKMALLGCEWESFDFHSSLIRGKHCCASPSFSLIAFSDDLIGKNDWICESNRHILKSMPEATQPTSLARRIRFGFHKNSDGLRRNG